MTNNTWHYQLMRHKDDNGNTYLAIHEYFPLEDGHIWTENPVTVDGESKSDIIWMLNTMLEDIEKHGVKDYE